VRIRTIRTADGVWVGWPGRAKFFRRERSTSGSSGPGHEEVRAPMTGKVVKVEARPGTRVTAGDVLVVMEAMKMEYRLAAPHDGTVDAVFCKPGDLVDLGRTLVGIARA
jgi:3-methylcrotonyl-CoA carboxylase alpha subunit